MPGENEVEQVSEQQVEGGVEEGGALETGSEGGTAVETKDWQKEYQTLEERYTRQEQDFAKHRSYIENLNRIYNSDEQFRKELERAIQGRAPAPAVKPVTPPANPQAAVQPQVDPAIVQQIQGVQQRLQAFERQAAIQQKSMEAQTEWNGVADQLGLSKEDQGEFWNRWQQAVDADYASILAANPNMPPQWAKNQAVLKHSANWHGEVRYLMEDKMGEIAQRRTQARQASQRGVGTKADSLRGGSTPGMIQQLQQKLQNTEDPKERFQLLSNLSKEMGVPIEELFSSKTIRGISRKG